MEKHSEFDEPQLSEKESSQVRTSAEKILGKQKRRAIIATAAFIASCAAVAPFLEGNPLHRYWDTTGKYLLLLSMGLLIPFVTYVGLAWSAWMYVRDVRKLRREG